MWARRRGEELGPGHHTVGGRVKEACFRREGKERFEPPNRLISAARGHAYAVRAQGSGCVDGEADISLIGWQAPLKIKNQTQLN
jgi:hypothetical protein